MKLIFGVKCPFKMERSHSCEKTAEELACSCCTAWSRRARNCSDWELAQLIKRCSINFKSYQELLTTYHTEQQTRLSADFLWQWLIPCRVQNNVVTVCY